MLIGVGLANILLVVLLLKEKIFNYNHLRLIALLPAAIAFFVNLYFGFYLRNMYPNFIQSAPKIFIISTIAFTLVFTVINGNKKIFVFILLMFSLLSTYSVHPIYRGTGPLLNNNLSNEFKRIKRNNNKPFRVVSYDSGYFENFMIANGINSLNGTYFYPQKNLMKILDPKNKYENVWNRFATVNYVFDKTNKNRFILSYADNYQINISPCNDVLNRLNVQYFIFENKQKLKCARLYKHLSFPARNFFIYKRL